jgi:hypothetical protein
VLAVIVGAGLIWAAYCFREFRDLEDRVEGFVRAQQDLMTRDAGRFLATVLRGGLVPFLTQYFEQRPTEVPSLRTADELRFVAMQMDGDPDRSPLVFRESLTVPLVDDIARRALDNVAEIAASIASTPEMLEAAIALGTDPTSLEDARRQARNLANRYLGQGIGLVVWAGAVLGALAGSIPVHLPWLVGVAAVLHGAALEISRRRLERRVKPPRTVSQIVRP